MLGEELGPTLGEELGEGLGFADGESLGDEVGPMLGDKLGFKLGLELGIELGPPLTAVVGEELGSSTRQEPHVTTQLFSHFPPFLRYNLHLERSLPTHLQLLRLIVSSNPLVILRTLKAVVLSRHTVGAMVLVVNN